MNRKTSLIFALLALGSVGFNPAMGQPRVLTSTAELRTTKTTYALFTIDPSKFSGGQTTASVTAALSTAIAPAGLTACVVAGDLNVNNMNCGNGAIRFGSELYTHNFDSVLPSPENLVADAIGDPKFKLATISRSIGITEGVNFFSPGLNLPAPGEITQFRFDRRIAQFGMLIDPKAMDSSNLGSFQIIVNRQTLTIPTPVATPAAALFIGIEDPHGFTEMTIVPGGSNQAWISNYYSIVPLASF